MKNPEEQLKRYILSSKELLGIKGINEIEHFFNHSEYEMAFEGLLIELTTVNKYPKGFNYTEWKMLGEHYNLDKDSVFDENIWGQFIDWGRKYKEI